MSYGKGSDLMRRFWVWGQSFRIKCPFHYYSPSLLQPCFWLFWLLEDGEMRLPGPARKALGREKGIGLSRQWREPWPKMIIIIMAEASILSTYYIPGSIITLYTQYPKPCQLATPAFVVPLCVCVEVGGTGSSESLV